MIDSLLVSNRGEIACRIMRTCRRLGIRTVAIYSDADEGALHVQTADSAIHLGPAPASDSYLNIPAIIAAAQRAGVDAIHPGYGFLAENADFARACADAGLIFIGPTADATAAMGNKRAAKEMVAGAGVPTIPGYSGAGQSDERLRQEADAIGYPVMVKAAAGGGGKGMRVVADADDLAEALASARREAQQAFGSDELILEKALLRPRHVEIQVFGDQQGNIIHLGERECSIQRRHQKIIEETPSMALTPELRAQMGETAVTAARTLGYTNAGTVEFLLDQDGNYYFLEMNTRLQVEHPVTEFVTGLDLVEWQIRVAEGEPLPVAQEDVALEGHAIEARLYAEDPANNFLPVTGPVALWRPSSGDGVRIDSGIQTGDDVSVYYDPMLAKVVVYGADRKTAVRRLRRALHTAVLLGLTTNLSFLRDVVAHPAFMAGDLHTGFIAEHLADWQPAMGDADVGLPLIAGALTRFRAEPQPATNAGYWRNNPNQPQSYRFRIGGQERDVGIRPDPHHADHYEVMLDGEAAHTVVWESERDSEVTLQVDGYRRRLTVAEVGAAIWAQCCGKITVLTALPRLPQPALAAGAGGSLRAPMPGSVLAVLVEPGQRVSKGQPLVTLEAMKMEHTIRTAADGVVAEIYYKVGDTVQADAQLLRIEEVEEGNAENR